LLVHREKKTTTDRAVLVDKCYATHHTYGAKEYTSWLSEKN